MAARDRFGTLEAEFALILHMDAVAREVWMAAGGDVIPDPDGVKKILEL